MAEGQHARLAAQDVVGTGEQRGDQHLDGGIHQPLRQQQGTPASSSTAKPTPKRRVRGHGVNPSRRAGPPGRTSRISSISAKGIVSARLDTFSVSSPPTPSAQAPRPTRRRHRPASRRPRQPASDDPDEQRGQHRAFQRAEAADHHHHEDHHAQLQRHVRIGGVERARHCTRQPGQRRTDPEHAHEHQRHVVPERLRHAGPVDGRAHDDADAAATRS